MEDREPESEALRRRSQELAILNDVARALNASVDLPALLARALEKVAELLGLGTGWVLLLDEATGEPYLAAAQNLPPGLRQDPSLMTGWCYCLDSFSDGELDGPANVGVIRCSRLRKLGLARGKTAGLLFHASVPLEVFGGDGGLQRLGMLNVAGPEWRELAADELDLLRTIGDMLGVAIERARLQARQLEAAQAEERNRLAREIHDTLAQNLSAIAFQLETAEALLGPPADPERARRSVSAALGLTRQGLEEARRSVLDLRAAPLEGRTLPAALAALAAEAETGEAPRVRFQSSPATGPLPPALEVGLYRIAQEALQNALRHAGAGQILLRLEPDSGMIRLTVEDDGRGFMAGDTAEGGASRFGLLGMRERARLLGGDLQIESSPGAGTRITAEVPLPSPLLNAMTVRTEPIRILLADDHPVVRDGLAAMLGTQPDFAVVGEAGTGAEAVAEAARLRPDVVLMDLEMPALDGIEAIRQLRARDPAVQVVVLTAFDTDERIVGALQAGAQGYLLKGAPRAEIFAAIRTVHAGGALIPPVVASKLLRQVRAAEHPDALTPREVEVLRLVAAGHPNKEIAGRLSISERTVKFHVSSLLAKLGVTNRTQAARLARERGL